MIPSSALNWARQPQQEEAGGEGGLLTSTWQPSEHAQQEWVLDQAPAASLYQFPPTSLLALKPGGTCTEPAHIQHQGYWEQSHNWENMILPTHQPHQTMPQQHHSTVEDAMNIMQAEPVISSISSHYDSLLNPSSPRLDATDATGLLPCSNSGWSLLGARNASHQQHPLWMQENGASSYNFLVQPACNNEGSVCNNNLRLYTDNRNASSATTSMTTSPGTDATSLDLVGLGRWDHRRLQDLVVKRELPATCDLLNPRIGLNLGGRTYFSAADHHEDSFYGWAAARFGKRFRHGVGSLGVHAMAPVPNCQADGCTADLSMAKPYHRRHKVCALHSKSPTVTIAGQTQRFCQQCSRFHALADFDDVKKSCRKRLADHNRRRRKPLQQPAATSVPAAATQATTSPADDELLLQKAASNEEDDNVVCESSMRAGSRASKKDEWSLSITASETLLLQSHEEVNNPMHSRNLSDQEAALGCGREEDTKSNIQFGGPSLSLTTSTSLLTSHREANGEHAYGLQWLCRGSSTRENALMDVVTSGSLNAPSDGDMNKPIGIITNFSKAFESQSTMSKSVYSGNNI